MSKLTSHSAPNNMDINGNRNHSEIPESQPVEAHEQPVNSSNIPEKPDLPSPPAENGIPDTPAAPTNTFNLIPVDLIQRHIPQGNRSWWCNPSPQAGMDALIDLALTMVYWTLALAFVNFAYFSGTYYQHSGCNDTSQEIACQQLTAGTYDQCEKRIKILSKHFDSESHGECPNRTLVLALLILVFVIWTGKLCLILGLVVCISGTWSWIKCSPRLTLGVGLSVHWTTQLLSFVCFSILAAFLCTTSNDPYNYCTDKQKNKWIWTRDLESGAENKIVSNCAGENANMYQFNLLVATMVKKSKKNCKSVDIYGNG